MMKEIVINVNGGPYDEEYNGSFNGCSSWWFTSS